MQRFWGSVAALSTKGPPGLASARLEMGSVPARRLTPRGAQAGRAILYLHGGAYVIGGPSSHGKLAAQIGHAAQAEVFFPEYRLAPEHPFPAALEDALAAYRWLLQQNQPPQRIVIAGDSAGGGLALAVAMAIRDAKLPQPAALVLISPWVDLTLSGESHHSKRDRDPMLRASWLAACAMHYAGPKALDDPELSPVFGDLYGLPPLLIQVGTEEILLSDSERLAKRAQKAGSPARLSRYDGLWHDFQVHAGALPESDRALSEIGAFIQKHLEQ
jgi:acetyl esterase/lipase